MRSSDKYIHVETRTNEILSPIAARLDDLAYAGF